MPGAIYGDSFGNLQSNILADEAVRSRTMESALQNALGALSHATDRRQRAEELTQQLTAHAADQDKLLKAHQPLVDAQVEYYKYLMANPDMKKQDQKLDNQYILDIGKQGRLLDYADAKRKAPNATDAAINDALETSQSVQSHLENEFNMGHKLAGLMTRKSVLDQLMSGAYEPDKKDSTGAPVLRKGMEQNPQLLAWQNERGQINQTLKPFQDNKLIDKYVQPSLDNIGGYDSAVPLPYHLMKRQQMANPGPATDADVPRGPVAVESQLDQPGSTNSAPMLRRPVSLGMVSRPAASDTGIEANPLPDVTMPTDNPPARPITTTGTAAPAGGSDYKTWVIGRAKQYTDKGFDPTIAITRARAEYNALFQ